MKILFLDVDGVLNHGSMTKEQWDNGHLSLDPACVDRVLRLCARTEARIVVSSTWRGSQEGMAILLARFGDRIIGVTPFFRTKPRSAEIGAWVIQHSAIPMICAVVDDDSDCDGPWGFFRTDADTGGLTPEIANAIEHYLLTGAQHD